jgi:dihydrofolate reductase
MRKLIVTNIVSLDGYYEGPGGNVMLLPMDHTFDAYNVERLRAADTLLLGRKSYDLFRGFWPPMAEDPDAPPTHRELARLENAIEKVVVSDSITPEETAPWRDTTQIVRRAAAREEIARLKGGEGREILTFASRTLWNDLLDARIVDELHLVLGAVALGDGRPLFAAPSAGQLRLLGARPFDGSNNVLLRYGLAT